MEDSRIPGFSIGVIEDGTVAQPRGFGNDGHGNPVTADTPFWIGSNTKSITALAVMQLAEAGTVDLHVQVRIDLPDFAVADDGASAQMTVRHLLNQTSGVSRSDGSPSGHEIDLRLPRPPKTASSTSTEATGIPVRRVDEILEQVGIAGAADRRAGAYSLGMRQRLGLAAALLGEPPVLIRRSRGPRVRPLVSHGAAELVRRQPRGNRKRTILAGRAGPGRPADSRHRWPASATGT